MMDHNHVLRFVSSRSIQPIEAWLARNCRAEWTIRFEGISDDLMSKNWEVSFSDLNDFAAFKLAIQQRGMPDRLGMRPLIGKERRDKGIHPMR
jgi:hypothetical protein